MITVQYNTVQYNDLSAFFFPYKVSVFYCTTFHNKWFFRTGAIRRWSTANRARRNGNGNRQFPVNRGMMADSALTTVVGVRKNPVDRTPTGDAADSGEIEVVTTVNFSYFESKQAQP